MKGYFITGTDTGVGKTVLAAAIAAALREAGVDVGVMKPVETGCTQRDGGLIPEDASMLKRASKTDDPLELINPYRFLPPVAPNIAARLEGASIDFDRIEELYSAMAARHELMLVEGAGGIMSPVTDDETVLDLIERLALQAIIVAPNRLGVINHALLAVDAAKRRGIPVKGLLLNDRDGRDEPDRAFNKEEIERLAGVDVLGEIPFFGEGDPFEQARDFLDIKNLLEKE